MVNKYYTPSIEDIHVGYECERISWDNYGEEKWVPYKIGFEYGWLEIPHDFNQSLRTPYLTKEDIEAEGWNKGTVIVENENGKDLFTEGFEKNHRQSTEEFTKWYTLQLLEIDDVPWIDLYFKYYTNQVSQTWSHIYRGPCPSINEFRKLCKWLNINISSSQ